MSDGKTTTELENLKNKLKNTWIAGDFGRIATAYAAGAAEFVARLDLKPGTRVLDVACGAGNLSLPAVRAGVEVTGIDIAPNLIAQARANAAAEGLNICFDVGDAEDMPYDDESFDVVMTMFGAMFTPRPDVTAAELKRVCRRGGVIAMANWTPAGFIGQMFKTTGKHVTPPSGMPSPLLWGEEEAVRRRFAEGIADLQFTVWPIEMSFPFRPAATVEHFREFYGPTRKAFEALANADDQARLRKDLEELWAANNAAQNGTTRVDPEYLEVKAIKA